MNNLTSISNETIDWDIIDVTEFVQIKENYINLDGKTEDYLQIKDNHLSEEDKNIEQKDAEVGRWFECDYCGVSFEVVKLKDDGTIDIKIIEEEK